MNYPNCVPGGEYMSPPTAQIVPANNGYIVQNNRGQWVFSTLEAAIRFIERHMTPKKEAEND